MNSIEKFGSGKPGEPLTMSSRDIADMCEKDHKNVLADIRNMLAQLGKATAEFSATALVDGPNGSKREIEVYHLPKRESIILVSGYRIDLRAKIVDRWQELEAKAANPYADLLPKNYLEALKQLTCTLEENQALTEKTKEMEKDLKIFEPKAQALDRIASTDGTFNMTNAAKDLNLNPGKLIEWLSQNGWIYKRPCTSNWVAYQDKITRGFLVHKTYIATKADGTEKICDQVRVTGKGIANLSLLLNQKAQSTSPQAGCATPAKES